MTRTLRWALWGMLAGLMVPGVARAGSGLEVGDLGVVPLGRGTAFTARADNLMAFHYNPAGLSKLSKWNVLLGSSFIYMDSSFTRGGSGEVITLDAGTDRQRQAFDPAVDPRTGEPYAPVSLQRHLSPLPVFVASYGDLGVEGLAVSVGILPASSFGFPRYPKDGAQRYALRDAELLVVYPGVGLSYRPNRYFSIGAVFMDGITSVHFNQAARGAVNPNNPAIFSESDAGDNGFIIEAKDFWSPTATFGMMSQPLPWLELGVALRLPVFIEAKGDLGLEPAPERCDNADPPNCDELVGKKSVVLEEKFPLTLRTGVRYIHRYFDVEVDYVFENWAALDQFDIRVDAGIDQQPLSGEPDLVLPDTVVPKNFRNAHSVRIGGDAAVWPAHLTARIGGWFQTSAYPKDHSTFNLDFPFSRQGGVSAGLTWHALPQLDVSVAYAHIFQPDVTVTDGVLQQQSIPPSPELPSTGNIINNGTYRVSMDVFGLSLEGHFGRSGKASRPKPSNSKT